MYYRDLPVPRPRTIETLRSKDILEIVLKELELYGVPSEEWGPIIQNHISPLNKAVDALVRKYLSEN